MSRKKTSAENCVFVARMSIETNRKRGGGTTADGQRPGEEQQRDGDRAERSEETHRLAPNRKGRAPAVIAAWLFNQQTEGQNGVFVREREEAAASEPPQFACCNTASHHTDTSSKRRRGATTKDEVNSVSEKDSTRFKGILVPVLPSALLDYRNH